MHTNHIPLQDTDSHLLKGLGSNSQCSWNRVSIYLWFELIGKIAFLGGMTSPSVSTAEVTLLPMLHVGAQM